MTDAVTMYNQISDCRQDNECITCFDMPYLLLLSLVVCQQAGSTELSELHKNVLSNHWATLNRCCLTTPSVSEDSSSSVLCLSTHRPTLVAHSRYASASAEHIRSVYFWSTFGLDSRMGSCLDQSTLDQSTLSLL